MVFKVTDVKFLLRTVLTIATTGTGTTTLTTGNGPQAQADNQARQAALRFTSSEASHTVQYPAVEKLYLLINNFILF